MAFKEYARRKGEFNPPEPSKSAHVSSERMMTGENLVLVCIETQDIYYDDPM
jgi:hypothetical protein